MAGSRTKFLFLAAVGLVCLPLIAVRWTSTQSTPYNERPARGTPVQLSTGPGAAAQSLQASVASGGGVHAPVGRAGAYPVFKEFVCERGNLGGCNEGECTISREDYDRVPWTQSADTIRREKKLRFDKKTSMYSVKTEQWNESGDQTGELRRINQLLNQPPDPSLCSNPLCLLGPPHDGGWPICIDENHLQNSSCVIYSVGVNYEPYFSVAAGALGCEVFMLDHTLQPLTRQVIENLHHHLHFHPLGLSAKSSSGRMVSLSDFMKQNHHTFVDVLKIDCEGCEWSVFESFANSHSELLEKVGQLLVEVHIIKNDLLNDIQSVTSFVDHVFGKHGFRVAHRHLNPWGVFGGNHYRDLITDQDSLKDQPDVLDYSFWELVLLRSM